MTRKKSVGTTGNSDQKQEPLSESIKREQISDYEQNKQKKVIEREEAIVTNIALDDEEPSSQRIYVKDVDATEYMVKRAESEGDLYGETEVPQNKESKKWMGQIDKVNPSPPAVTSSTDIHDSENEERKHDDEMQISNRSLIDDCKLNIPMYRRTESTNASLLVEAALDAAEREIGAVSGPILEHGNREVAVGNLYSISSELDFKTACSQDQAAHRSPTDAHLEAYMQDELTRTSPGATPRHTPPHHVHLDYHMHKPVEYVNVSTGRTHIIEQYLDQVSQEMPTSPPRYQEISHPHLQPHHHTPAHLHHHQNQHQHQHQHQHRHDHHARMSIDNAALSSDEGDLVAQNLSLSVKEKNLQQFDLTKYDGLQTEFDSINRERVRFESLIIQTAAEQGLDMSARGFQQAFGSQSQNSDHHNLHHHHLQQQQHEQQQQQSHHRHLHHPHPLYEISERERQGVDLSRTAASLSPPLYPPPYPPHYSHVEVSRVVGLEPVSRSHNLHTSVTRLMSSPQPASSLSSHLVTENLEARILSSPPPSIPVYNTTYPVAPTSYHASRPGYHYSGYY